MCNCDWPRTCYVNQVGPELGESLLSLAALQCWDHRHVLHTWLDNKTNSSSVVIAQAYFRTLGSHRKQKTLLTSELTRFTYSFRCAQPFFWFLEMSKHSPRVPILLAPSDILQASQIGSFQHLSDSLNLLTQSYDILAICYLLGQSPQAGLKSAWFSMPSCLVASLWYSVHKHLESRVEVRLRREQLAG